jgi:hypothetical protein
MNCHKNIAEAESTTTLSTEAFYDEQIQKIV